MRPFDRNVDGVGTRIAVNPNALSILRAEGIEVMLLGTVITMEYNHTHQVAFDKGQAYEDERYVDDSHYIIFDSDEDAKKVRPFNNDRDGVGSRVAVSGMNMPAGNDVRTMYYGTIKRVTDSANPNFFIGIEFDSKIVSGNSLGGLADNDSGLDVINYEVFIIDGSATKNVDNSFFLKSIADVLLSTTSETNFNRIEVVESSLAYNFGADGKEAIEYALESTESFNLFKEILEGLRQMEARRLGVSVKPKIETLTPAPAIPKAPRKKKDPVLAEPVEIITPDTSVFQNEDELSSLLDEFLT